MAIGKKDYWKAQILATGKKYGILKLARAWTRSLVYLYVMYELCIKLFV